jgi:hypothetical protein
LPAIGLASGLPARLSPIRAENAQVRLDTVILNIFKEAVINVTVVPFLNPFRRTARNGR